MELALPRPRRSQVGSEKPPRGNDFHTRRSERSYSVPAVAKQLFQVTGGEKRLEDIATESALGTGGLRDRIPREKPPTE